MMSNIGKDQARRNQRRTLAVRRVSLECVPSPVWTVRLLVFWRRGDVMLTFPGSAALIRVRYDGRSFGLEVYYDLDALDVQTTCSDVRCNKHIALGSELLKRPQS